MNHTLLGAKVARHLAARLTGFGTDLSGERLQELAAGKSATDDESDAITHLMLTLLTDYLNHGGKNYALINEITTDVHSRDDAVAAMLQLCRRLVGRVE
ncbi:hypothetical protein [Candidatus Mycobacterium methanotrophicum]|uniref:Uncharacterized protein n=1 Tax=Candidatus Mycobacterium methanotrophicum TaxID=2943498 RepID=A0ABY4QUC0_9MYCO|nr:hypothetical protein [Candidatus Mycobacterium methanotrophicum]UQX13465.1 hypothetical protein M5I08_25000 [Candidatus Mycobacterium methanotrophicum]